MTDSSSDPSPQKVSTCIKACRESLEPVLWGLLSQETLLEKWNLGFHMGKCSEEPSDHPQNNCTEDSKG